jgi:hypothetical protein
VIADATCQACAVKRRDVLALVTLVVLAGGLAVGATYAARAAGNDSGSGPVTITSVQTETVTTTMPASPTAPVTMTVTKTVTKTPNHGAPATKFGNGTFEVGFDVASGRYRTQGPAQGVRAGCVWKRTEPGGGVIAQGTAFGPLSINVHDGELMTATGCQQWSKG